MIEKKLIINERICKRIIIALKEVKNGNKLNKKVNFHLSLTYFALR
jgi:hypothetical protein